MLSHEVGLEAGQFRLAGRVHASEVTPDCPIASKQIRQIPYLPERGAPQGQQAREAVYFADRGLRKAPTFGEEVVEALVDDKSELRNIP
jgi:hypothetical protein